MYDHSTGHAVRAMLASIAASRPVTPAQRAALKERIDAAVDELKSMGWPVERIMIRVKEVAAETGLATRVDPSGRDDNIVSDAIRWCIERYYAES